MIDFIEQKQPREEYGRYGNPGEKVVERKLAALEGGEAALLFASGMAAVVGLLMAKLNAGDEVVFFDECYHRSREFCAKHLSRFGVVTRQVPACDYEAMEAAITPRHEAAGQRIADQSALERRRSGAVRRDRPAARRRDADRRHAGHALQRAAARGRRRLRAALGHQVPGRAQRPAWPACSSATTEKLEPVRKLRGIMGAINSPHNIYLLERGLKTFELRMQRHNDNGLAVAQFLAAHPKVERVYYPGLASHPYYEVARRTMRGFGGLVTFLVKDADWRATARVVDAVKLPRIGPSLGGVESLIEQPLVMSYYECTPEERQSVWHSRQHDPPVVRHRKRGRPGGRFGASLGPRLDTRRLHVVQSGGTP